MHNYLKFIAENIRWLAGGLLLTVFSSFGQTFFIALFSGEIRSELQLSHGQFGAIYMAGTLLSAMSLIWLGKVVDQYPVAWVACGVCVALAFFCGAMASVNSVWMLFLVIFGLRLCGQGMMTHTAITAMGRWYVAERGRAVSLTNLGLQIGEGLLPLSVAFLLLSLSWRQTWWISAMLLLFLALPSIYGLMRVERVPRTARNVTTSVEPEWSRRKLLLNRNFQLLCVGTMGPGFIGTAVFFHLVHIGDINNWSRQGVASSFIVLSLTTTCFSLLAGLLVDRWSARRLLPFYLLPLGFGCIVLSLGGALSTLYFFMFLLGLCYGFSGTLFGSIWAEVYGTENLGSIRAVAVSTMVLASAMGPGVTGWLLDVGIGWSLQLQVMAIYCLLTSGLMVVLSRRLMGFATLPAS